MRMIKIILAAFVMMTVVSGQLMAQDVKSTKDKTEETKKVVKQTKKEIEDSDVDKSFQDKKKEVEKTREERLKELEKERERRKKELLDKGGEAIDDADASAEAAKKKAKGVTGDAEAKMKDGVQRGTSSGEVTVKSTKARIQTARASVEKHNAKVMSAEELVKAARARLEEDKASGRLTPEQVAAKEERIKAIENRINRMKTKVQEADKRVQKQESILMEMDKN